MMLCSKQASQGSVLRQMHLLLPLRRAGGQGAAAQAPVGSGLLHTPLVRGLLATSPALLVANDRSPKAKSNHTKIQSFASCLLTSLWPKPLDGQADASNSWKPLALLVGGMGYGCVVGTQGQRENSGKERAYRHE